MSRTSSRWNFAYWAGFVSSLFLICMIWIASDRLRSVIGGSALNVTWLLNGSEKDFAQWFPRFHAVVYWTVKCAMLLIPVLTLFLLWKSGRAIHRAKIIQTQLADKQLSGERIGLTQFILQTVWSVGLSFSMFLSGYVLLRLGWIPIAPEADFAAQRTLARGFDLSVLVYIMASVALYHVEFKQLLRTFLYQKGTPHNLAFLRILYFGFMTVVLWKYPDYHGSYLELDPVGLPYMQWFTDIVHLSRAEYTWLARITAVVNFLICIGMFTRPMLLLNAVLVFLVIATPNFYGKLFHQHLWIWIPWILAFSKCADIWSVDAWLKNRKHPARVDQSIEYVLPIRLIWLTFGAVYFFPGFHKLWTAGFDWALSDSMLNQIFVEWHQHYGWRSPIPIEDFPGLAKLGGLMVIFFELSFPFLILHQRTRYVAVFGGLAFHTLTGLLLRIWFPPVLWMYVFFFDWSKLFKRGGTVQGSAMNRPISHSSKAMIVIFTVLFIGNVLCGFLSVYSYPFTMFPGYTTLYPSKIGMLHIEVLAENGQWTDLDDVLKTTNYRREDNTPYENAIITAFMKDDQVAVHVHRYWKLLRSGVQELNEVQQYAFYYRQVFLHPDSGLAPNDTLIFREEPDPHSQ